MWKTIAITAIGVVALGLILFVVLNTQNRISNWWYSRGTEQAHAEIQKALDEAAQSKQIAADALKALEQEKKVTAAEREKRELAESLLADKTKTANEKLRIYEEAINKAPTITPVGSVDELCARARAAGIECGP